MPVSTGHYAEGPEALVVSLAIKGDRDAFAELVRRRQWWIRTLMRRCCGDLSLADDLSQQVFMQAWRKIRQLKDATRFGSWIKRLAINEWLQYSRKNDPLGFTDGDEALPESRADTTSVAMDLDHAMAALPGPVSLCIALSYHERLSHPEIEALTGIPIGTVKSHIRRGSARLRELLSAYDESGATENE
ncbi:MAG: sigma-70 family RNA polymerase sigma factor [Gammaproteobacteria bacterium]|jgi:RNA polymerase sigma-70 factor (ECF subfamily)|nr:sigma-70 family RNA polymerase sigma factor [Gammaproteobacteria bacterium]MDH3778624.1 sigma-70 family RNA polymerase sigma factor [Gammaproteobacteria bacterium]